jgi:hypothetical protein
MALVAECPRCPAAVVAQAEQWVCPLHGVTPPLWRARSADYDSLVEHLELADGLPTWVPWPLPPGWSITDFGVVCPGDHTGATVVACSGLTDSDGLVSLTVVSEEPGTGLGARVTGVVHDDPGAQTHDRPVQTRAQVGGVAVPLWLLSTSGGGAINDGQEEPWDRAVLVGEAQGRWLWLLTTPASAALGLGGWGPLEQLGDRGPALVELPFGARTTDW